MFLSVLFYTTAGFLIIYLAISQSILGNNSPDFLKYEYSGVSLATLFLVRAKPVLSKANLFA